MLQCKACKTFKKADNCRKCAETAFDQVEAMTAIIRGGMNDMRKIEKLEILAKTCDTTNRGGK